MAEPIEHGLSFTEQRPRGSHRLGKRAVVIGAGIGGLSAAGALAQYFERVDILERDRLATSVASRSGTPQDRHPHGLLAGGLRALDQIFPGYKRDLAAAGGVPVTFARNVQFERPDAEAGFRNINAVRNAAADRAGAAAPGRGDREHHAAASGAGNRDRPGGRWRGRARDSLCQRLGMLGNPRRRSGSRRVRPRCADSDIARRLGLGPAADDRDRRRYQLRNGRGRDSSGRDRSTARCWKSPSCWSLISGCGSQTSCIASMRCQPRPPPEGPARPVSISDFNPKADVAREFGIDLAIRRSDKRRHTMTPENQSLVRDSFAKVEPITLQAAAMFYDRLFVLDPSLKPLFKSDLTEQGRMLMPMIGTVVANLGNLETIIPAVQDLGRRHAVYGVQSRHYETVGAALLWTLEQSLGDAFTLPVKAAWTEAYTVLSSVMQKGADGSVASPGR